MPGVKDSSRRRNGKPQADCLSGARSEIVAP
jgi:hypothetical protein